MGGFEQERRKYKNFVRYIGGMNIFSKLNKVLKNLGSKLRGQITMRRRRYM
jgi:hypothetical protein